MNAVSGDVAAVLAAHRASGRRFSAAGISSFVLDQGPRDAEPVVCVHGVPASAYLYRKVVAALADRGLRGIAVDLPGLGLAERPAEADYTWSGLGRWTHRNRRLGPGPVPSGGARPRRPSRVEVAAASPGRVLSLTVLNTLVAVETFNRPWPMEPFAHRGLGEAWLRSCESPACSSH